MNEVPLIEKVQKNDINTTIIAIKKQLKELNALLGLIDIQSDKQDLSPYVRKDEVIDEVKRFDLSPVTSNAVSKTLSYSTSEVKTGGYWIDGKPIYRKCFVGSFLPGAILVQNVDSLVGCGGNFMDSGYMTAYPLTQSSNTYTVRKNTTTNNLFLGADGTRNYNIWVEYTKTTD